MKLFTIMKWLAVWDYRYTLTFLAVYVPGLIVRGFNCNRKTVTLSWISCALGLISILIGAAPIWWYVTSGTKELSAEIWCAVGVAAQVLNAAPAIATVIQLIDFIRIKRSKDA